MSEDATSPPELIAIGALNDDYYGSFDLRYRLSSSLRADIETRRECLLTDAQIEAELLNIGKAEFGSPTAGGSSLNTARTVASLGLGIRVGFVGVLGGPAGSELDAATAELDRDPDLLIRRPDLPPGRCLVFRRGSDSRLLVAPGANVAVTDAFRQPKLPRYLASARWIHVSSFHNRSSLRTLGEAIDAARGLNPALVLSFDPGDEYTERLRGVDESTGREGPPYVEEFLNRCDYLFLNGKEAKSLARISGKGRVDPKILGQAIFKVVGTRCRLVIVKYRESHIIFQRRVFGAEREVLVRRWWHLLKFGPIDDVGAGDVFAGGFIAAHLRPYFVELGKGPSRLGASLVHARLGAKRGIPFELFRGAAELQLQSVKREAFNLRDFLAVWGGRALAFAAGAVVSGLLGKFL